MKGHSAILDSTGRELMERLREHGYTSQRSIARALHEHVGYFRERGANGRLRKESSTAIYLNQILLGRRTMSAGMADGLVQLCGGDDRVLSLVSSITTASDRKDKPYLLEQLLDMYFGELKSIYHTRDEKEKLQVLMDFHSFVRSYACRMSSVEE